MKKAKIFLWFIVFGAGSLLSLSSCENKSQKNKALIPKIETNKPTEEEIKYFIPTGVYDLYIKLVGDYESNYEKTGYIYMNPEGIENQKYYRFKG